MRLNSRMDSEARANSPACRAHLALFDAIPHPILLLDSAYCFVAANPSATALLRGTEEDLVGRHGTDVVFADDLGWVLESLALVAQDSARSIPAVVRVHRFDGTLCPVEVHLETLTQPVGGVHFILALSDASAAIEIERFAAETISDVPLGDSFLTLLRSVYATATIPMSIHWTDGSRPTANFTSLEPWLGALIAEESFANVLDECVRDGIEQVPCPPHFADADVRAICCAPMSFHDEIVGAAVFWIPFPPPVGMAGVQLARHVARLATLAYVRRADEQELLRRATTDPLTGMLNRNAFLDVLGAAVADRVGAALIVDLDRFKRVNDQFGHATGDEVLIEVTKRMRRVVGDIGSIGRMGGDEFAIVIRKDVRQSDIDTLIAAIVREIGQPIDTLMGAVTIGASVGSTQITPTSSVAVLMDEADHSMYFHKQGSRRSLTASEPRGN
jgi:diguanylate cyclase (GGDEF)-like protein/PAS domain S-box-containing protein